MDSQRYDTIHCLKNNYIHAPYLDRLCSEGVAFTRAYSQSPVCSPSCASFLTGLYPSSIGVNRNGLPEFPTNPRDQLITKRLADEGYDYGYAASCTSLLRGTEWRTVPTTAIGVSRTVTTPGMPVDTGTSKRTGRKHRALT